MAQTHNVRLEDGMTGIGLLGAGANVVMQLAWPAVGYGVVESTVESGKLSRHPIKRFRTTVSYLSVAVMGTEQERRTYREAVNKQHAQVRSGPNSPVKYNAFDRELQLWVAACRVQGNRGRLRADVRRADRRLRRRDVPRGGASGHHPASPRLFVARADRVAFAHYWKAGVDNISIDDRFRNHLLGVATRSPVGWPLNKIITPVNTFFCAGFLPPEFRDQMQLTWTPRDQRRFDRVMRALAIVNRFLPNVIRRFPFNFFLWDVRRRIAAGTPLV